jgi:hypothetical protein
MIRDDHQLTDRDCAEAVAMWLDGFDTLEIAHQLNTRECIIYSRLPIWRAALKSARAA